MWGLMDVLPQILIYVFGAELGQKIGLYQNLHTGIGIQLNLVEFIGYSTDLDWAFGSDTSGALTRVMTIEGTGNVGINDDTPTYKLDVNGTLRIVGRSTLAHASSTMLTVSGDTYLATVQAGTWNGTAIDFSTYTNATAGTGITFTDDAISTNDSEIVLSDLSGYVANGVIDWTIDQGATNIDAGNYTDTNTTPSDSTWTIHDSFSCRLFSE